jgi:hypothetical protein
MSLENLDRTQWSFNEALTHVETVVVAHREFAASRSPSPPPRSRGPWGPEPEAQVKWKAEARQQLMVALRDGDLHAQGRYTEEQPYSWGSAGTGFGLHSGHHSSISPEQWREARYLSDKLTAVHWEFVDIRIARFMVLAIWPTYVPPSTPRSVDAPPYTTPYLALMHEAIERFGLCEERQEKKECLFEWFVSKHVDGKRVSNNLADAMATLIRLPRSQHGGSKRVEGPDLRQAG